MESRGNVYQNLIFAAQKALDETGELPSIPAQLSQLSGIDETDIGNIFRSDRQLHEALLYHAVTLLNDAVRQSVINANSSDPLKQLRAIGHGYLCWAENNPTLFRLVVDGLNGEITPESTLYRFTVSMRDLYRRKLTEMQRLGILSADTDIEISTMMLHCLVKGGNMMFLTRNTDPWFEHDDRSTIALAENIFTEFLRNLVRANRPVPQPA
ncbi:hypothetical protein ACFOMH_09140 [Paracoccus mangrovi]|jgi:hypothetical protein|uniref:Tetracyclin repressor-like C-terminal domain-containing protein n=1 Tax=Paracoccus mangrovi TaxID=1715645 RepID=A0ABV7R218_9RHOB